VRIAPAIVKNMRPPESSASCRTRVAETTVVVALKWR
jgi:hypothetical protein